MTASAEMWGCPFFEAHAAYRRFVGRAAVAEVREVDDVFALRTGVHSDAQNGAVSVRADLRVARRVVAETIAWLRGSRVPASWLCAEPAASLASELVAAGCRPETSAWEMYASLGEPDTGRALRVTAQVSHVTSQSDLDHWASVAAECGWFRDEHDKAVEKRLYGELALADDAPLRLYIARERDRVVGMAVAFLAGSILLLDSVAVLASERRRGIGRSLVLARLRDARERGCTIAVLAPSPDGRHLYDALGFRARPQPPNRWFYLPAYDANDHSVRR